MKHRWAALMLVLALSVVPRVTEAQSSGSAAQPPQARKAGSLGQNYPNPFNPETRIPFVVGDSATCGNGQQHRVTLRIYNLLAQLVAVPLLVGGTGNVAGGQPLENVVLSCGSYTAYWDGKYLKTDREVASGIYLYRLELDGKPLVKRMIVMK